MPKHRAEDGTEYTLGTGREALMWPPSHTVRRGIECFQEIATDGQCHQLIPFTV